MAATEAPKRQYRNAQPIDIKKAQKVDAPPPIMRGRRSSQWDKVVDFLNDNPGDWYKFEGVAVSGAQTLRKKLGKDNVRTANVDQESGLGDLYVRAPGPNT
jgi:hypothetical protein